jgi:hypothetical protein
MNFKKIKISADFWVFEFLLCKTPSNQNSIEIYQILLNFIKFDGIAGSDFFAPIEFSNPGEE